MTKLLGICLAVKLARLTSTWTVKRPLRARRRLRRLDLLQIAYSATTVVRAYRERYGWRIAQCLVYQAASNAAFILLKDMHHNPESTTDHVHADGYNTYGIRRHTPISDRATAFEECFRCLLGTGLQHMLPCGIARMVYHTSRELKVQLPEAVEQMLQMVAETSWQPSDLHQISSLYPNWVTEKKNAQHQTSKKYDMDEVLTK